MQTRDAEAGALLKELHRYSGPERSGNRVVATSTSVLGGDVRGSPLSDGYLDLLENLRLAATALSR